jgi:DNA repair protein RadC
LAILFRTGIRGKDAVSFSREIMIKFSGLRGLFKASNEELLSIKGMGKAKLTTIRAAIALAHLYTTEIIQETTPLVDPDMVYSLLLCPLRDKQKEEIWLLALDGGNRYKNKVVLNKGSYGDVNIWAGRVIKKALAMKAAGIILAHNHPGQKAAATPADIEATNRLQYACKGLDISLQDHIIVGVNGYFSFKDEGLI